MHKRIHQTLCSLLLLLLLPLCSITEASNVINRSPAIWDSYRWQIIMALIFILIETVMIFFLTIERKLNSTAQFELEKSSKRLENIIEGTHVGTWEWYVQTGEMTLSDQWAGIIGYSLDEIMPVSIKTWERLFHPEDFSESKELLNQVFAKETDYYVFEYRMKHKSGDWVWVLDRGNVVSWAPDGKPYLMSGTHTDITKRKLAELALKESLQSYRTLADSGQALIWKSGPDKSCYWFNKVWLEFTGRTLEQERGNGWTEGVHPDDFQRCLDIYSTAFDKHEFFSMDYRLRHHDGFYRWIQDDGCPNYDTCGNFLGYLGYCLDIDTRKNIETDLRIAMESANSANAAKSQFLANMSHEIRTPLNGVMGTLQLLEMTTLDEEQRYYTRISRSSSDALLVVLNDILDYSKIEAGKIELENIPFLLDKMLQDAADLFQITAKEKSLVMRISVDDSVPNALVGDGFRLRQILSNLIGNAIKFTKEGCIDVGVRRLETHDVNAVTLEFRVQDTGIGIDSDKMEILFKSFSQADNSNTRLYGGTGLGLAISKGLAEKMGGKMWADSGTKGSNFYFTCLLELQTATAPCPETA